MIDRECLILLALQAFYLAGPRPYMCRRDPIRERDRYWIFIERVLRRIRAIDDFPVDMKH